MHPHEPAEQERREPICHCCPSSSSTHGLSRRTFLSGLGTAALATVALSGLSWEALAVARPDELVAPPRTPLVVKPILIHDLPVRQKQTSWRNWGGIHTSEAAAEEVKRIQTELQQIRSQADFPVEFLEVSVIQKKDQLKAIGDLEKADTLLVYAAGGYTEDLDALVALKKNTIFFIRHRSGPVYLWYEIISPRFLRHETDANTVPGIDTSDVVVDSVEEVAWRLRSLCGLRNTMNSRILAIGGAAAWAQPEGVVPELVRKKWGMEIRDVSYDELGRLIKEARNDKAAVEAAKAEAEAYLKLPDTQLETEKVFVENACLLKRIFQSMMAKADCRMLTINSCMGTIMPLAETSACLTLSMLNDAGYMAFCESDFVVIPSGILLGNISGLPTFLNDPTYPHDGVITVAHCTAPRKMDGKKTEPARILTHFESDYGAAPKVEMKKGQPITMIAPDFKSERWVGFKGDILENPFMPICRSQQDIGFKCSSELLAERMPGFHWMMTYGDYAREVGYALKKVGIKWEYLA